MTQACRRISSGGMFLGKKTERAVWPARYFSFDSADNIQDNGKNNNQHRNRDCDF